jgi:putative ABC transport system permease protein
MPILALALKSVLSRRLTAALMVVSISLSVMLLLGVERLRAQARAGFANTISGTDLVVGARTGATALLLHAVFRIGYATNNVSWTSYQEIARHPRVRWTIPLSLGDSFRGFTVLGTNPDYFRHYQYAGRRGLEFGVGAVFVVGWLRVRSCPRSTKVSRMSCCTSR